MTYFEKIIDITTGKETIRPYTVEENAQVEAALVEAENERLKIEKETADKLAARAEILQKLGLTEDEAKVLLG